MVSRIVLLTCTLLIVSGCVEPGASPEEGLLLHQMDLRYHVSRNPGGLAEATSIYDVRVVAVRDIIDWTGQVRQAYHIRVIEAESTEPAPKDLDFFLDGGLRRIRMDQPCSRQDSEGTCVNHLVKWSDAGSLPPFGIGLPVVAAAADPLVVYGQSIDAVLRSTENGSMQEIEVVGQLPDALNVFEGQHVYEKGALFPVKIEGKTAKGTPVRVELLSVAVGSPLEPVPHVEFDKVPHDAETNKFQFFRGESEDPYGVDFPVADAFDHLVKNEPAVREALDYGGCVDNIGYLPQIGDRLPLVQTANVDVKFDILDGKGSMTGWKVTAQHDMAYGRQVIHIKGTEGPHDGSCPPQQTAEQTLDLSAFLELTDGFPTRSTVDPGFWVFIDGLSWRHPASGKTILLRMYGSATTPGWQDTVVVDAHTGWLESVNLPKDDVKSLDEEGWRMASG